MEREDTLIPREDARRLASFSSGPPWDAAAASPNALPSLAPAEAAALSRTPRTTLGLAIPSPSSCWLILLDNSPSMSLHFRSNLFAAFFHSSISRLCNRQAFARSSRSERNSLSSSDFCLVVMSIMRSELFLSAFRSFVKSVIRFCKLSMICSFRGSVVSDRSGGLVRPPEASSESSTEEAALPRRRSDVRRVRRLSSDLFLLEKSLLRAMVLAIDCSPPVAAPSWSPPLPSVPDLRGPPPPPPSAVVVAAAAAAATVVVSCLSIMSIRDRASLTMERLR
mmetsp:Transcript_1918/g.4227  ORF Transcript_1918/g.4227 Transcript_1918/m.4227 type:complete len:280 (-) Transcript_1918:642-1481(-)